MIHVQRSANDVGRVHTSIAHSFPEWHTAVSESFVPLQVTSNNADMFRGRMRSRVIEDVSLVEVTASSHTVMRTPSLIASSDRRYFKLSLQLSGTGLLIQDNREAALRPGDLAVYDTHRPYTLEFEQDFRAMVLMFPHSLIGLPVDAVGQLTAVRMPGDEGIGKLVSPFLVQLANNLDQLTGGSGSRLAHSALDLITTLFAAELNLPDSSNPHQELTNDIRDYIEAQLGNPELCPAMIAGAHYISTRHLHNLFQLEGTTVASWIRARRLEHCRRDLRDPVYARLPIAAVAARWGFIEAAHFSRIFRAAFGESPSRYRGAAAA
ncbi:helix-turn-helix domain-containing protein [Saxibacter everestensis]|uniref:Helix-turn-helix domain-containing protein n=1 Tax=Saxibacter everestensis TaxID=2909229 RepID=A0ABY8QSF3_9MICO|nr:helix-turn-helix domain-containing protein [Brevibacteriaceae bacterium ZFBP1038]